MTSVENGDRWQHDEGSAPPDAEVDRPERELLEIVTDTLLLREAIRRDLPDLLPVYRSHEPPGNDADPDYLLRRLVHEWRVLETLQTHHTLAIYRRTDADAPDARPVGVLDYMEASPQSGVPWLGLVMVHRENLHRGIARETMEALFAYGESLGWTRLGTGIPVGDLSARAFLEHFGFVEVGRTTGPVPGQEELGALAVLERALGTGEGGA